jgi:hypothetical protein
MTSTSFVLAWLFVKLLLLANPYQLAPQEAFVFECARCGMEFMTPRNDEQILQNPMGPFGVSKHCPLCQGSALFAIPCPQCRASIIRPPDDICPDCGVNIVEALNRKVEEALRRNAAQRAQTQSQSGGDRSAP